MIHPNAHMRVNSAEFFITLLKNNTTAFTPTTDYQPATKKYVDENGGIGIVISATQPSGQAVGDFWYEEG